MKGDYTKQLKIKVTVGLLLVFVGTVYQLNCVNERYDFLKEEYSELSNEIDFDKNDENCNISDLKARIDQHNKCCEHYYNAYQRNMWITITPYFYDSCLEFKIDSIDESETVNKSTTSTNQPTTIEIDGTKYQLVPIE